MPAFAHTIPQEGGVVVASEHTQRYYGFAVAAKGGRVEFNIREGNSGGTILTPVTLNDGESGDDVFPTPIWCQGDLFVEMVTGGEWVIGSILAN